MRTRILSLILAFALCLSCLSVPMAQAAELSADASVAAETADASTEAVDEVAETPEIVPEESEKPAEEVPAPEVTIPEETAPVEEETPAEVPAETPPVEETPVTEEEPVAQEEAAEEETAEVLAEEETLEEAAVVEDVDPIHLSIQDCYYIDSKNKKIKCAELIGDVTFNKTQTVTAATFSSYKNTTGLANGATIQYNRLVTLKPVGLVSNSGPAATNNSLIMTAVMRDVVRKYSHDKKYANVMFKVVIPAGYYNLGYCMYLYSNTWLSMDGATFCKYSTANSSLVRSGSASDSVSGYNGESNIIIQGGTWDCRMTQYSYKGAAHFGVMRFGHNRNVIIANSTFNGAVNGHHVEICGTNGLSITGCTFSGYRNTAHHGDTDYKEAIQLDIVNNADTCPTYAKFDDTITQNAVIYGNKFNNCCRGIGGHSAIYSKPYTNIVIDRNTFTNLSGAACHLLSYKNTAVINNNMNNVGGGVEMLGMCKGADGHFYKPASGSIPAYSKVKNMNCNNLIAGNTIKVNTGINRASVCGILVGGDVHKDTAKYCKSKYGNKSFTVSGVTIKNNTILSAKDAGIMLKYASNCSISNNSIASVVKGSSGSGYGVQLHYCTTGINVNGNNISNIKGHGIYLKSCTGKSNSYVTLAANTVDTTASSNVGVYFYKTKYAKLTGSRVSAKSYAVQINGCSGIYVGNVNSRNDLRSNTSYAVYVTGKSKSNIRLYYNDIVSKKASYKTAKGSKLKTSSLAYTKL